MKKVANKSRIVKQVIILLLILSIGKVSFSQNFTENKEIFGLSYHYETSKILKDRMFAIGNYIIGRRSYEVGISMKSYTPGNQGFLFQHKVFLNKKQNEYADFNLKDYKIKTYAIYKFIMFGSPANSLKNDHDVNEAQRFTHNPLTTSSINTIEHYLGIGVEFNVYENLSIEAMGVGGVNIIKNNSKAIFIDDQILPKSDLYLSWDISIGMNYRF